MIKVPITAYYIGTLIVIKKTPMKYFHNSIITSKEIRFKKKIKIQCHAIKLIKMFKRFYHRNILISQSKLQFLAKCDVHMIYEYSYNAYCSYR